MLNKPTLYHYVHCPFCLRVRLALGFLKIDYQSIVLEYHDEKTPHDLIGKKMLPILKWESQIKNESLDIISWIDEQQLLTKELNNSNLLLGEMELLLNKIGESIHSLAMPYWIYTPEFNQTSREYFQKKKEIKRGPFSKLLPQQSIFIENILPDLEKIETLLSPYFRSQSLSLLDIMLASHLWGLYIVPEFQFSEKLHQYLQNIKSECHFNYHQDLWGNW